MMITEEVVRSALAPHVKGDRISLGKGMSVGVPAFLNVFAEANSMTYGDLLAVDGYVEGENPGLGYKVHLDRWHSEGLI